MYYIMVLTAFTACDSSNNKSSSKNRADQVLATVVSPEAVDLSNISLGSFGTCLDLDFEELECASSREELDKITTEPKKILVPLQLISNSDAQIYEFTNTESEYIEKAETSSSHEIINPNNHQIAADPSDDSESNPQSRLFATLTGEIEVSSSDLYDYTLYKNVTDSTANFFNFLNEVSSIDKGIDASGAINKFVMETNEANIPVSYSVDCKDLETTFHLVTGKYGLKLAFRQDDVESINYEVKASGMSKGRDQVIENSLFCRVAENRAEAIDAIGNAAQQTGQAIEQGVQNAGEAVEGALDATAEAVADGLETNEDVVLESAAIVEGTVNAVGNKIVDTAVAAKDEVNAEIDEARQENEAATSNVIIDRQDEESGFRKWLRELFN